MRFSGFSSLSTADGGLKRRVTLPNWLMRLRRSASFWLCASSLVPLVGSSGLEPPTLRLSGVRSNHLSYEPIKHFLSLVRWLGSSSSTPGGDEEDRTPDPLRARQVLSQLSYTPSAAPGFLEGLGLQN